MDPSINKEILDLEPSTLISLYQLVLPGYGASYFFHAGENGYNKEIYFRGNNYYYIPINVDNFEFSTDRLSRPTLTIDNTDSFFSLKSKFFKDFIGFPFYRTRTFVKFLHGNNFPGFDGLSPTNNPFGSATEVAFPAENYVINKKVIENQSIIQFELSSALEKENSFIPSRKVVYNTCQWRYRSGIGCCYDGKAKTDSTGTEFTATQNPSIYDKNTSYSINDVVLVPGAPKSDEVDKVFVSLINSNQGNNPLFNKQAWALDTCLKNIDACRLRFGSKENINGLPFGGFPGSWK